MKRMKRFHNSFCVHPQNAIMLSHYLATFTCCLIFAFMLNSAFIFCSLDNAQRSLSFSSPFRNKFLMLIAFILEEISSINFSACLLVPAYICDDVCMQQHLLNLFVFIIISTTLSFQQSDSTQLFPYAMEVSLTSSSAYNEFFIFKTVVLRLFFSKQHALACGQHNFTRINSRIPVDFFLSVANPQKKSLTKIPHSRGRFFNHGFH